MEISANSAGLDEGADNRLAGLQDRDRRADRSREAGLRWRARSGAAFRCRWDRPSASPGPAFWPSAATHCRDRSTGRLCKRHRLALAGRSRSSVSAARSGTMNAACGRRRAGLVGARRAAVRRRRDGWRRRRPARRRVAGQPRQRDRRVPFSAATVCASLGGSRRLRLQRRLRAASCEPVGSARACAPDRPARSSAASSRDRPRELLRSARQRLVDIGRVRQHHIDRVGADVRDRSQIEEGRDRLDVGASQVDRIEVEGEEEQQRQSERSPPARCRRSTGMR